VVLILLTLAIVGPVAIMFGGAIWSGLIGWLATEDAEASGAGQESASPA
jgi:hypothetical protein